MTDTAFTPWPCTRLSVYPLPDDWNDLFPQTKLSKLRYEGLKSVVQSFMMSPQMSSVYANFRDYAWQQGAYTNANRIDQEFFRHILVHDFPFFLGHKKREICADFKIDEKKYPGLPLLRPSYFDLYRVLRTGLGFTELEALLHPGRYQTFFSPFDAPKTNDVVFARLLPVGFIPRTLAYTVVEPWDAIDEPYVEPILSQIRQQFDAFREKFPQTTERAFMKIAGYHVYELIQSFPLRDKLNKKLSKFNDEAIGVTVTLAFKKSSHVPAPADCPHAAPVLDNGVPLPDLATAPLRDDGSLPETLREAIISREKNTLEITTFMRDAGQSYLSELIAALPKLAVFTQTEKILDANEFYRALRHVYLIK